jgi:hypothetical protein
LNTRSGPQRAPPAGSVAAMMKDNPSFFDSERFKALPRADADVLCASYWNHLAAVLASSGAFCAKGSRVLLYRDDAIVWDAINEADLRAVYDEVAGRDPWLTSRSWDELRTNAKAFRKNMGVPAKPYPENR